MISRAAMMLPVLLLGLTACEKPILSEDGSDGYSSAEANVILHFTQFEQAAFTRAATDITELGH